MTRAIGVVGAGRLGATAAALVLSAGSSPVVLVRPGGGRIERARRAVWAQLDREHRAGRLSVAQVTELWSQVQVTDRPGALTRCSAVFECVPEELALKQQAVATIEGAVQPGALVASSTSSIPAAAIGARSARPDRVCVAHLVWPAHRTRFAEIAFPEGSGEEVRADLFGLLDELSVTTLVTRDVPGFLITRLLLAYWSSALGLVAAGASPIDVDRAMEAEGLAMGPIRLLDATGAGTALRAARGLAATAPEARPLLALAALVDRGVAGGGGEGIYQRASGGTVVNDAAVALLRAAWSPPASGAVPTAPAGLADAAVGGLLDTAAACIADGVVGGWDDVSLAVQRAYGFPAVPGGVVGRWPATVDLDRLVSGEETRTEEQIA